MKKRQTHRRAGHRRKGLRGRNHSSLEALCVHQLEGNRRTGLLQAINKEEGLWHTAGSRRQAQLILVDAISVGESSWGCKCAMRESYGGDFLQTLSKSTLGPDEFFAVFLFLSLTSEGQLCHSTMGL